jgi:hypothetical protein
LLYLMNEITAIDISRVKELIPFNRWLFHLITRIFFVI